MTGMERARVGVCRECRLLLQQSRKTPRSSFATSSIARQWPTRSLPTSALFSPSRSTNDSRKPSRSLQTTRTSTTATPKHSSLSSKDLSNIHTRILELTTSALRPEDGKIPSEQRLLYVLEQLHAIAVSLADAKTIGAAKATREENDDSTTATSALLGSVNHLHTPTNLTRAGLLNTISANAEQILRHPNVFITAPILSAYINLQALLHQPASFPDIFHLYATKPSPRQTSANGQVTYQPISNPNKINLAVPSATAQLALTQAITTHNLPLTLDIITTTFSTPAFRRSKLLRQALLPFSGLAIAPLAAYTLSTQFSLLQTTMDTSHATTIAFAGIMTYIATVSSLGYVVITTANDQMDRVTWAKGVPLWERWVREEERRALDDVAGEWGFRDHGSRGLEEGEEWEVLREECGRRGMVLDRVELMEGME